MNLKIEKMSTMIKKKNKKKKKKKKIEEIKPQNHEKLGNLNFYSEETTKDIIEKIISLAISSNFARNAEKKFTDFCFESMKRTFNSIIQICNIDRDKDDFDIDNIDINEYIKTNKSDKDIKRYIVKKHNNALELRNDNAERNITQIARIAKNFQTYNNIKLTKKEECLNKSIIIKKNEFLKKDKKYQYSNDIEKKNFWGEISCPQITDIDRTSYKFNSYIPIKEELRKKLISPNKSPRKKRESRLTKKPSFIYKNFASKLSQKLTFVKAIKENNYENLYIKKSSPRVQVLEMPSYPLKNIEQRKESDEILNLRKEKMEMIIQKQKEYKKLQLEKLQSKKEEAENAKKKMKGKYTFDGEGKLIVVNEIKQDHLFKEFWPITSKQKEVKGGKSLDFYKKETIKMENNAKKNIIYNDEEENANVYSSFLFKSRLTEPFFNFGGFNKNNSVNSQLKYKRKLNNSFFDNFNKKQKVEPSGSNFNLINPSIGVKVTERKAVKSGGLDYFKEFKKYSIDEFNKTLQDTFEWTKYKPKDKSHAEGFKSSTPSNELTRLRKSILSKTNSNFHTNDISNNELNSIIKTNNNNYKKIKRNLKIKNREKNFGKTFSDGFNFNQEKRTHLIKSTSEIILTDKKFINLKEILFHDDKDKNKFIKNIPDKINRKIKENMNIFNQNVILTSLRKIEFKKIFSDVDKLNKDLISGNVTNDKLYFNNRAILPKISNRKNETNFNRTMINFNRERVKKSMWEKYVQKKENITSDSKKIRKVNSVKLYK